MRQAHPNDIATLVNLMAEFYAESDYKLDRPFAEKAFATILADKRLGYVWIIDDLFVVPQSRNRGLRSVTVTAPPKRSIVASV
jgi:hypothetical protein